MNPNFSRHIMRQCSIIHRSFNRLTNRRLSEYHARGIHVKILRRIDREPGTTQAELCDYFSKDKGAITRSVAHLEKQSYIRRENDKKDKRISRLYLTADGETMFKKLHSIYHETETIILGNMDEASLLELESNLKEIIDNIKAYEESIND